MSQIIVNRVNDSITGSYKGKPFGVTFSEQKYAQMKELESKANAATSMEELALLLEDFEPLIQENYKEIIEHAKGGQHLFVNPHNGKLYLAINGKVSSKPIPKSLADRIITSVEKNIDVLPLVKCWTRFLRNPWYTDAKAKLFAEYINTTDVNTDLYNKLVDKEGLTPEVASARATQYDVNFTEEGLLVTLKVVREVDWKFVSDDTQPNGVKKVDRFAFEVDEFSGLKTYKKPEFMEQRVFEPAVQKQSGDSFFSDDYEGHIIRVGKAVYLDSWDKVNTDDSHSCVKGIHLGGSRYVRNFQDDDTITLTCFVDPMFIGAIDKAGTGALRVLKFFPYGSFQGITKSIYHSSQYAQLTDAEYSKLIEEAVEASQQDVDKIAADLEEKKNLL